MPKSKTMNDEGKEEEDEDHAEDVLKEIREDNIRAARKQRSKYNKTAATTTKSTNSNQRWPAK